MMTEVTQGIYESLMILEQVKQTLIGNKEPIIQHRFIITYGSGFANQIEQFITKRKKSFVASLVLDGEQVLNSFLAMNCYMNVMD